METARKIEKVVCPVCNFRLCDKEDDARGHTRKKCIKCKRVWRIDLAINECTLIAGNAVQRR